MWNWLIWAVKHTHEENTLCGFNNDIVLQMYQKTSKLNKSWFGEEWNMHPGKKKKKKGSPWFSTFEHLFDCEDTVVQA